MYETCTELAPLQPFGQKVGLIVYGTLAGGFLTDRWLGKPEDLNDGRLTWMQSKYKRFIDSWGGWALFQQLLETLRRVADRVNQENGSAVTIANIALRFVLEQPFVDCAIVGARLGEREHIEDNQRVFSFRLSAGDKEDISGVLAKGAPIPGDCGDEYRLLLDCEWGPVTPLESCSRPEVIFVHCHGGTQWQARSVVVQFWNCVGEESWLLPREAGARYNLC